MAVAFNALCKNTVWYLAEYEYNNMSIILIFDMYVIVG